VLGKTTITAIRSLLFLNQQEAGVPLSPRRIAEALGESPTYLAKVLRHLVKAGVLRADKGAKGGVRMAVPPEQVTLLQVVEACQGTIVGNYCAVGTPGQPMCGFHHAAVELHDAITGVLSRWTLADLLVVPYRQEALEAGRGAQHVMPCLIGGVHGF
jgi:Rrf2 family transcriptional regulator, nitric oxide-sensitive transcriptional repressor